MGKMNETRVFLGGIVGGIVGTILDIFINGVIFKKGWDPLMVQGIVKEATLTTGLLELLLNFVVALAGTQLYAIARPRLVPGPLSALRVSLLVGLLVAVTSGGGTFIWMTGGRAMGGMLAINGLIVPAVATFLGAWVYKE